MNNNKFNNSDYTQVVTNMEQQFQDQKRNSIETQIQTMLERDSFGRITRKVSNILVFLRYYPRYAGKLMYNEFLEQKEFDGKEFDDFTFQEIMKDCETVTTIYSRDKMETALSTVFNTNRYNPVSQYLTNLQWDGQERVSRLFIDLLQADDTPLNHAMTRKWFIAAVKRIMEPGSKFDNMIVLQGGQGIGKSTICELISKSYNTNISLSEIGNKDLIDKLNKTWIGTIDELDSFNRKDMTNIKTFLSLNSDSARLAYAVNTRTFPRHCVFIGTTNDDTFLRDATSPIERRFWVIKCNKTKCDTTVRDTLTPDYVDQLWAEAYHYYMQEPGAYLDIDASLMPDFEQTMRQYKTFNSDEAIEIVTEMLDKEYYTDNGEFPDIQSFFDQLTNKFVSPVSVQPAKINKIPASYVTQALRSNYRLERSAKYIGMAIDQQWEHKVIKYKGKTHKGYFRREPIINDSANSNSILETQKLFD